MKKRILSLLLCGALMFSLCFQSALAAENGQTETECICTSLCTTETIEEDCPVCGAENANFALCEGEAETAVLPNAEAVNHAANSVDVPYLDATGSQQSCSSYTVVDTTTTAWNEGWYVAEGNVTISEAVILNGDVHIILTDGCSLTVDGGIGCNEGASLTVYAQSTGDEMGKLTAIGGQTQGASIGINVYKGGITINGGAVTATGSTPTPNPTEGYADVTSGVYAYESRITVNGGTLTATGGKDIDYSYGIYGQNITVTGGTVTAIGEQAKLSSTGIYVAGLLTVNGGTVNATAGNAKYDSIGIASQRSGSCVINGGVVTAIGGTTSYYESYGIYFFDGNITISGGTVTATAGSTKNSSMGICAFLGNITISGGTITATGGTAEETQTGRRQASSIGIYAVSGVKISGGTVTATGGAATDEAIGSELAGSCGIFSPQSGVEISGGTITATGGTAPYSFGICANGGITVNGGHVIAETKATSETHIALNAAPALPNTTYWWRTAATDEFTTSDDSEYVYNDTHTYVEVKVKELICAITFDPNGGVVNPTDAITNIYGRLTNLPTPTRSGSYRFDGWYTAAEDGTMVTTETVFTEDTTLYAHWRYNSGGGGTTRYTVKFETNGGSKVSSKTVKRNTAVSEPTKPTKDGYTFDGWYSDKELKTAYDFTAKVAKSFTLYAKWTEKATEPEKPTEPTEPTEPTAPEWKNPFTDVSKNDWFFESVKYANENGLMGGTTNTTFAPNEPLTRSMLVAILYRAKGEPAVNKSIPFGDVDTNAYYANAVIWAQQNGIVNGVTENDFAPDSNITREQIAAIMFRFAKYKGYDVSVGESTNILSYTDAESISEYAISAMQYAFGSGLMKGKTETTINPLDFATRAEIAAILQRFIEANK